MTWNAGPAGTSDWESQREAERRAAAADDAWQQAYNNAAELFYGKVAGDLLTEDEDERCIAEANAVTADGE